MNDTMEREPIGLNDANGNPIHLGDIVEFFACPVHGISKERTPCAQRTVDFIGRMDGKSPIPGHTIRTYFAVNLLATAIGGGGMFAHKIASKCRIVGNMPKDAHMLVDEIPAIVRPTGEFYTLAVKAAEKTPLVLTEAA